MRIQEPDFILEPVSDDSNFYNLIFYKRVKKRDTGQYETELGNPIYGITLSNALSRVAKSRTAKKYAESVISIKEYLRELNSSYKEIVKLCKDELPEKFDTGE